RACMIFGSIVSATRETEPTRTPRKVTGEPGPRPPTDPSKYTTAFVLGAKAAAPPKNRMPATTIASPPRTKPPTPVGLARGIFCLRWPRDDRIRSPHESLNGWMVRLVAQIAWGAVPDPSLRLRIEEDAVIADRKQAGQFVTHNDYGHAKPVAQFQDQFIEPER